MIFARNKLLSFPRFTINVPDLHTNVPTLRAPKGERATFVHTVDVLLQTHARRLHSVMLATHENAEGGRPSSLPSCAVLASQQVGRVCQNPDPCVFTSLQRKKRKSALSNARLTQIRHPSNLPPLTCHNLRRAEGLFDILISVKPQAKCWTTSPWSHTYPIFADRRDCQLSAEKSARLKCPRDPRPRYPQRQYSSRASPSCLTLTSATTRDPPKPPQRKNRQNFRTLTQIASQTTTDPSKPTSSPSTCCSATTSTRRKPPNTMAFRHSSSPRPRLPRTAVGVDHLRLSMQPEREHHYLRTCRQTTVSKTDREVSSCRPSESRLLPLTLVLQPLSMAKCRRCVVSAIRPKDTFDESAQV